MAMWLSWGSGGSAALLTGDRLDYSSPQVCMHGLVNRFVRVVTSGTHSAALTQDGRVYCWGDNAFAQCGQGSASNEPILEPKLFELPLGEVAVDVALGWWNTVVTSKSGRVFVAGHGRYCGVSQDSAVAVPSLLHLSSVVPEATPSQKIRLVSCGFQHTIIVCQDNSVFAWGRNRSGQLGLGDCADRSTPQMSRALAEKLHRARIVAIACGRKHSVALTDEGSVWSTGGSKFGELGIGCVGEVRSEWSAVDIREPVAEIACGWSHTLALTQSGSVWGWGRADYGQIGEMESNRQPLPKAIAIPSGGSAHPLTVRRVFCGSEHSFLLCSTLGPDSGTVELLAFGWNEHGNLGLGFGAAECVSTASSVKLPEILEPRLNPLSNQLETPTIVNVETAGAVVFAKIGYQSE